MITVIPLLEASVLIIGGGDLADEILRNLKSHGISFTRIDASASTANSEESSQFIKQDPEEWIQKDPGFFKSFHIVLCINQPRSLELALSDLRWPINGGDNDPDLPMIVMRNVSNNCKMRCQYRELLVDGSKSSRFVSLPMDLLPWTDEKRDLISSMIRDEFKPEQNPIFQAYIMAALAVIDFHQSKGSWPVIEDRAEVQARAEQCVTTSQSKLSEFVELLCENGLAGVHETTEILGHLVSLDAIKLLTGNGQPINNANIEEIIKIAAKVSAVL